MTTQSTPTLPTIAPESRQDRIRRLMVDFMPVVLVALLALSTLWLVRSMPEEAAPAAKPAPTEPDYYMRDFRIRAFDTQGKLTQDLRGAHGDHQPGPDQLRITQPNSTLIDKNGIVTTATADRSVSDRKGNDVHLYDNVKVVRTSPDRQGTPSAPVTLESDYLHIVNRQQQISTDHPVRITQGNDTLQGTGMQYTGDSKELTVNGRVHAVIPSANKSQTP